jgi:endonuclease/exonuclease/phosphatase (EEP) superfamily protein YafD
MKWWARTVTAIAAAYPVSLLVAVAILRYVGERFWLTGVGLYVPRLLFAIPLPFIAVAIGVSRLYRLLWTQAGAILILLFPLMGFVPRPLAQRLPEVHDDSVLRVLSYNINSGAGGFEKVVDEINAQEPDLILLQEVGSSEALKTLLGERYPTIRATGQFFFASRYPVSSTIEPPKLDYGGHDRSPRYVQQIVETPLGRIAVYNVHPISPRETFYALRGNGFRHGLMSGRPISRYGIGVFKANSGLRALQVETFAEAAGRETDPVILAGDTNLPTLSYVFNRYLSGYQDGFTEAGSGFGYTYPTNRRPWMRIDRILASSQLRFVEFEVGSSLASDHLCVVAALRRRGN